MQIGRPLPVVGGSLVIDVVLESAATGNALLAGRGAHGIDLGVDGYSPPYQSLHHIQRFPVMS